MLHSARLLPLVATALLATIAGRAHAHGDGFEESGEASWYGGGFAGQRTSSGARFDPGAMTAAHTTLPLGSRVRVTLERTGASVVVTVTDRMPDHGVRVIDLSREAASRLGILRRGTAMVTISSLPPSDGAVEVADAPGDDLPADAPIPQQHGPRHRRPVHRAASRAHACCRAQFASRVRHSIRRPAIRHRR